MKMHHSILVLTMFFSLNLHAQITLPKEQNDSLTSLQISFESVLRDSAEGIKLNAYFEIVKKEEGLYGISNTGLYCGTVKVSKWETLLTDSMISSIHKFLFHLSKTPYKIDVPGFQNDYYSANFQKKEWNIKPDQNILGDYLTESADTIDFPILDFYKEIFKPQIQNYIENRNNHMNQVDSLIARKWYINSNALKSVKKGSEITFYSSRESTINPAFWEFETDFGFNHSGQYDRDTNSRIMIEYNAVENLNSYMYLSILNAKNLIERNDVEKWMGNGITSFYILKLNSEELILKIAY